MSEIALQTYCGGTPKTANEEFWKGNIPWIQSSDLLEERLFNVKPRKYISQEAIMEFAKGLDVLSDEDRQTLLDMTPASYIGYASNLCDIDL